MTRLRHLDHLGTARFVTFGCHDRIPFLSVTSNVELVINQIDALRLGEGVKVLGYVIMPDHVHFLLLPPDDLSLGPAIGRMKSLCARLMVSPEGYRVRRRKDGSRAIWLRRFYDHNCRYPHVVVEKLNYCHLNPVKAGLVSQPGDWLWSSYRWFRGERDVPLTIDVDVY